MAIPALIAAAARIIGPMLAEGGAAAAGRGAAGAAGRAGAGGVERGALTKLEQSMAANPTKGGGGEKGWAQRGVEKWAENNLPGGPGNPGSPGGPNRPVELPDLVQSAKNFGKAVADAATKAIQQSTRLVNNDFAGAFRSLEVVPEPIRKFVGALSDATKAILNRVDDLKGYNGNLANASAQRDVKLLNADIREANAVGPAYSRVTKESTDLEVALRDIAAPFKANFAEALADLAHMAKIALEVTNIKEITAAMAKAQHVAWQGTTAGLTTLEYIREWARHRFGDHPDKKPVGVPEGFLQLDEMFKGMALQLPGRPNPPPLPNAKDAPLGVRVM
jgi:hypothetical protein